MQKVKNHNNTQLMPKLHTLSPKRCRHFWTNATLFILSKLRLSLNLSSVFKFNLSRAKQSLPKISTKFLSVCLSVCLSVRPENQTLFRWRNFFWGNRKTHQKINRHNDCALLTAPAGGERSEPTAGARGVGELKRIPYPKKLDEEEKFCM